MKRHLSLVPIALLAAVAGACAEPDSTEPAVASRPDRCGTADPDSDRGPDSNCTADVDANAEPHEDFGASVDSYTLAFAHWYFWAYAYSPACVGVSAAFRVPRRREVRQHQRGAARVSL